MSNVIPDGNKVHSLGKNDGGEIIRWNELWVGLIDTDVGVSVRIPNVSQTDLDLTNPIYDALQTRGHISLLEGDFFIRDFVDKFVILNIAEELKNLLSTVSSMNQNNDLNYIRQINEIGVNNSIRYNPNNKILTLYTDDINEVANDPGLPHLWWTQGRFDLAFSQKNSTDLNDSNNLLRFSDLNFGVEGSTGTFPGINQQTMKIDPSLLPPNIVNVNNMSSNKSLVVGTLAERDTYLTPFEGLFWKILDNTNPIDNDLLYVYNGTEWLEVIGNVITQNNIITKINNSNSLQIDNSKNLTNFTTQYINEYQNINFDSARNVYFSRQRLNDSIYSPDNTILITKNSENQTTLSLVGYNPISTIEQVYNSLGFSFVPNHSGQYFNSNSNIPTDLYKSFNFRGTSGTASAMTGQIRLSFAGGSYVANTFNILKPLFFVDTNYLQFSRKTSGTQALQVKETAGLISKIIDEVRNEILSLITSF